MESVTKKIQALLEQEHTSVWAFCSEIEDAAKYFEEGKPCQMLASGLREWAYYQEQARKEYESIIKQAQDQIHFIDENLQTHFDINADRVKEYKEKAAKELKVVLTVSYIIGLDNDTTKALFALVTKLQFGK